MEARYLGDRHNTGDDLFTIGWEQTRVIYIAVHKRRARRPNNVYANWDFPLNSERQVCKVCS